MIIKYITEKISVIIPDILEVPHATVYAMSAKTIPNIAGKKQLTTSRKAYYPILATACFFINTKDTQKGIVYIQTTGIIEHNKYKKPSSIVNKADNNI